MAKASDNVFPKVITGMQTSDPAAPSDSSWKLYSKAGGIYARSSNTVVGPFGASTGLTDPMTTRGDIIVRNSSNVTARLAVGATANMALKSDGTDPSWALIPGTLIAIQKYAPAQTTFSATTTTFTDMDATNMAVTFTAPASGNVLITLTAYHDISVGTAAYQWCLRESSSVIADSVYFVNRDGASIGSGMTTVTLYLTGISAGSHTYKWAHAIGATVTTGRTIVGPGDALGDFGPAIMAVFAA